MQHGMGVSEFREHSARPYLAAAVAALALAAVALLTPLGSAALGALEVFRVQRFAAVTVDPSKVPWLGAALAGAADRDLLGAYSGPLKLKEPEAVGTLAAAEARLGHRLASVAAKPGSLPLAEVYVGQAIDLAYTFDAAKIQAAIAAAGLDGVTAPRQLDGKTFRAHVAPVVAALYGSGDRGFVFAQTKSPWLEVPDGVDMDYLRQDLLSLPGLPPELVSQLLAIKDWKHTLVVPLPPGGKATDVAVSGNPGLLVSDVEGRRHAVLWQRGGTLYLVAGQWPADRALATAAAVVYP